MLDQLQSAADHIFEINSKTREEALRVKKLNILIKDALEKEMINKVDSIEINLRVAAVDGGLLTHEMHGVDLIIVRACGVVFEYENSKLKDVKYHPNPFPESTYKVEIGLDEQEINAFRSLFRLQVEIDCAIETLEKLKPDILFLDGSIIPLSQDKPSEDSPIFNQYIKIIQKYKKLYKLCEENNCTLIGITKDSRGRRFMDTIKSATDMKSADTVFLNHLLEEKERTFAIRIGDPNKHPILRDLGEFSKKLNIFYIKPVRDDRPLRIEFLNSNRTIQEIASVVQNLSSINKTYAYPAVLIEADLRAMLDQKEMERMRKTLEMISSNLAPLRRNSRPFR